ncbi:MAG: transposase zinc-binding domain-containing protein [Planctomycetes bacterium]|nr:transposase zinc-binding domain-containing protein [Planctomycetota bacterium]
MTLPTTTTLGIVDEYEGERVETEFRLLLGFLPLTPVGSYYRRNEDQRYLIELNTKSLVKATLAQHGLYLTILMLAVGALNFGDPIGELLLLSGFLCGLISSFARFRLGKPTATEERQRAVHLEVTGVSGLPGMLPLELVQTLRDALERKWVKRAGEVSWEELLDADDAELEDLKLLAVLASLDAQLSDDVAAPRRAKQAWATLEDNHDDLPLESISPEEAQEVLRQVPKPTQKGKPRAKASRGIKIRCERCEHVTRVPHSCAGRTGRCPSCAGGVRVPSVQSMRLLRRAA